jgi:hypothetical protein
VDLPLAAGLAAARADPSPAPQAHGHDHPSAPKLTSTPEPVAGGAAA